MTTNAQNLHHLVSHCEANPNLAVAICKLIDMAPKEEQVELFVRFLYEFRYTPTDKSSRVPEELKGNNYKKDLFDAKIEIDRFVRESREKHMTEKAFHEKLWEFICEHSKNDKRKKALYFAACPLNHDLPYIDKTKAMSMTQSEFESAEEKIDPLFGTMIRHVSEQGFSQVTEDASMYLPILEMGKTENERAILLSLVLMNFRSKVMPSSLRDLLEDDDE